ncbi:Oidioi.mRNA.OKI2018_I69.chr1.g1100.t1.cds [Oikopleura dioica]|uniref:Oidioi.mRNA.OKI2018_I69.chr1.g1100.t1.cds n=1 Tax=Oikopleura dioica TaxID=34765 RepID=A0ABN7SNM4_OIKDI|nr:Oidioi.mRNA.OKI2018_I69.chr1.g1100.t1.cds [Oikopleura dioica]
MKLLSILLGGSASFTTSEYSTSTTTEPTTPTDGYGWTTDWWETVMSTTSTGFFEYPNEYPPFSRCTWTINLGENKAFQIIPRAFDVNRTWRRTWNGWNVDYVLSCFYDHVTVNANGVERTFCGKNEDPVGRSVPDEDLDEFEPEEEGKHHDGDLSNVEEGFPIIVVPSGSAVVTFQSNWDYAKSGFELEIAELSRLQVIEIHAQRIFKSLPKNRFGERYQHRMERTFAQMKAAYTGDQCYEDNGFGEEAADINVFDENDMCKLNGQINAAINSFARNYACEGRGKVHRQIIRSARKTRNFYAAKNDC